MDIGKLNRMVTIEQQSATQDDLGQPVMTWSPLASVWANVRFLSGVETIKAGTEASVVKASIRIRHRTDVTTAMRVLLGSTTFQVKAVLPDESGRRFVDLACEVIT